MIDEVFDNLVAQFSDPFTFYRELIQNAVDAGPNRVDVTVHPHEDTVVIEVADDGEGMNREIIDHQLTKLFSSSKENDLTKIGKFGIGFVSVFAIQPEMVLVDTGRGGEYWRVMFDGTTHFECRSLEQPVEGTRVRIYKRVPADELEAFVRRSRETIRRWCRYSDCPVFFDGGPINEPLEVDSPCQVRHEQTGTELVCGLTAASPPSFGMYNRGLTLREGHELFLPGVSFRLKSRYLEHTLTRDNVIRDRQYQKALDILRKVVRGSLTDRLFELVERGHEERRGKELSDLLHHASPFLAAWKTVLPREAHKRPLLPTHHHGYISIADLRWSAFREGAVYFDARPTPVSEALAKQDVPVAVGDDPEGGLAEALQAVTGLPPRIASQAVAAPPLLDSPLAPQLEEPLLDLLHQGRRGIGAIRLARFDYDGSCVRDRACLLQAAERDPIRLYDRAFWRRLKLGSAVLLLNAEHGLVRRALETAPRAPLLSAFVLAKAALLQDGLPGDLEARMVGRFVRGVERA
jgi:predicted RNA-binding protein with PIN domain